MGKTRYYNIDADGYVIEKGSNGYNENVVVDFGSKTTKKRQGFVKTHFTAKRIAYLAVFTALSFVISLIDFPIFPQASMLKLDFGNVFILLAGFMFGPVEGVIVCVIKELLHIPIGTTGGVGELANMIMATSYLLIPTIVYRFKKGIPTVVITLFMATLFSTAVSFFVNKYINFPLFGDTELHFFNSVKQFIIYFNLIKWSAISVITLIVYKPLHKLIKKFD